MRKITLCDENGRSLLGSDGHIHVDGRYGHDHTASVVASYRERYRKNYDWRFTFWTHWFYDHNPGTFYAIESNVKPYPRRCAVCGEISVFKTDIGPYEINCKRNGTCVVLKIDTLMADRCSKCNEVYFTMETDETISERLAVHNIGDSILTGGLAAVTNSRDGHLCSSQRNPVPE